MRALWMVGWCLTLAGAPAFAAPGAPLEARVVEASLFKNGLAYVTREVDVPGAGEHVLSGLPVPVHGSFWLLPEAKGMSVDQAVAFSSPRSEAQPALTLVDLLRANTGRKIEVLTEPDGWMPATVEKIPEREPKLPVSLGDAGSRLRDYGYWWSGRAYRPPTADTGRAVDPNGFVLLRTDKGMLALPPAAIKGLRDADGNLERTFPEAKPGAALRLRVSGSGGRLRVSYLEWGLTWAPSYQVEIGDPREASIRAKAVVLNDAESLGGTTLQFITGYPNLAFAEAVDPIALIGDVSDFLQSLVQLNAPRRQPHAAAMQQVMMNAPGEGGGAPHLTEAAGQTHEDLFFYPQPGVTLARGERGYYPLFTKRVPCDDLYAWEIPDSLDGSARWRFASWYDRPDRQEPEQEEVWHSLRLTNAGGIPWTTAPAVILQDGHILGQDTLGYTAPGAKTMLKITRAVDVSAEQGEMEIERQRNARTAYGGGREYDLITIKGELRVFNNRNKPLTLLVKKTLSGEVLETAPKAAVEPTVAGVWRVNQQQRVVWELPIAAGGKQYLTYRYKVYATR